MNSLFRVSALTLALIAGTALAASPAMAGRDHDRWGGKSWSKKHYKHYKHRRKHYSHRRHRGYDWDRRYYSNPYRYGHYHRRGWFYGGPGFSLRIY